MSDLLRSPRGKIVLAAAGGALLLAAAWFLLVAPQRAKADELAAEVSASEAVLAQRKLELASPSVGVTVKPSDLYRLTKALPDQTNMSGVLLDVDRLARRNALAVSSLTPTAQVLGTGYLQQPVSVVVQGRFGNVSRFLGDLRKLVRVRHGRLDARGRLYSVSRVNIGAPDAPAKLPVVKAEVTLNAYSFSAPAPTTPSTETPTTPDPSSSGTVAAGATP
jgi:hypothetical protein